MTAVARQAHCESCGATITDAHTQTEEGYTHCCNELVCYGDRLHSWRTQSGKVLRACCAAHAESLSPTDFVTERLS